MNVILKTELKKFVADKVKGGQYASPSDVVNQALEVFKDQELFSPEHEKYLRREVRRGLAELDAGRRAHFDAGKIIRQERRRLTNGKGRH